LLDAFATGGVFAHGAFALEQGALLTAMIWAALTVEIIEQRFLRAAAWAASGAALSLVGLAHAYAWAQADTVQSLTLGQAWPWAVGYGLLAMLLVLGTWLPRDRTSED
jgi:AGZA family xanthine/uracil permease-like MFS transporter